MEEEVLMPRELTAENGAKSLLIGEFHEEIEMICPECDDDLEDEDCHICNGSGFYTKLVPISWTNIKAIYKKAVDHIGVDV